MSFVSLAEAREEARFGGKAVSLGHMLRRGLPVPDGFALSVELVRAVHGGDAEASESLRELHDGSLAGRRFAVRSSAVGEDSAGASFAGQHLTLLGLDSASGLVDATRQVWASGCADSALEYRRRMGIGGEPQVAAVVQHMVDSVCAGVLFCRDPLDGADRRVIEASWGLGEVVVAGLVAPDRFVLSPSGELISSQAGFKDIAIEMAPDGETREVDVPQHMHSELCVTRDQLVELSELARACENVFGSPQDIEWAYADGKLVLLQSRPITTRSG